MNYVDLPDHGKNPPRLHDLPNPLTLASTPSIAMVSFNFVPEINPSAKYERLGPIAIENHRQYCARHGITFQHEARPIRGRPACWSKFDIILDTLKNHDWVIWVDSDALILDHGLTLTDLCDFDADIVSQCPAEHFAFFGYEKADARRRMPINTGVFAIRASDWSFHFLKSAARQTMANDTTPVWNGIGDQEAMIAIFERFPAYKSHVRYLGNLHCHPRFYRRGMRFVHFLGNRAPCVVSQDLSDAVLSRWETALAQGLPLNLEELPLFHLSCIQCKPDQLHYQLGDLDMVLYRDSDLFWQQRSHP